MSGDSSLQLQASIYLALAQDPILLTLVKGVFDHVPQQTELPYITVGQETAIDNSTLSVKGMEQTISVHSWSNSPGRKEVKQIMEQIYNVLHEKKLAVAGHSMIYMRFEYSETIPDIDYVTYHGIQRFRVLTMEV